MGCGFILPTFSILALITMMLEHKRAAFADYDAVRSNYRNAACDCEMVNDEQFLLNEPNLYEIWEEV